MAATDHGQQHWDGQALPNARGCKAVLSAMLAMTVMAVVKLLLDLSATQKQRRK